MFAKVPASKVKSLQVKSGTLGADIFANRNLRESENREIFAFREHKLSRIDSFQNFGNNQFL